jgi:hypothetical protein
MRLLAFLAVIALLCGCLSGDYSLAGWDLLREFDGLGGGSNALGKPGKCIPPAEPVSLTLSDCASLDGNIERYSCYSGVALVSDDPEVCDNIPTPELRAGCVTLMAECRLDERLCDSLGDNMGMLYTCLGTVAEAKEDVSICYDITNPAYRNPCIRGVASALGDIGMCDGIDSSSELDRCVLAVAVKRKDASICRGVSGRIDYWRQDCVKEVSMASQDMVLCASLDGSTRAGKDRMIECVKNITSDEMNVGLCNHIKLDDVRDYHCITPNAVSSLDPAVCGMITDNARKIDCVKQTAVSAKDAMLCERVSLPGNAVRGSYGKNDCIIEVAKTLKDENLCERITDNTNAKKDCVRVSR